MLLGDPGASGGWELEADGWAQGLFKAAARVGGLLCWVFSRAVAAHNEGPGMPPFFAFFSYICLTTCSLEGSQPLAFSSCWLSWALLPQSLGLFLLPLLQALRGDSSGLPYRPDNHSSSSPSPFPAQLAFQASAHSLPPLEGPGLPLSTCLFIQGSSHWGLT